ncbi:hypothetical protein PVAP13_1KG139020 [Panicum virgatum]|uniref:Uncharacterized protein n=1 Tax=Panicum virgatum TaxID=38727 RepID=A0A8T0XG83_PANVG|nr:hypothetical protein PVAP13_1KG139020 [Panicum virgatum]
MNLANKSESSNLKGNPVAILAPATICHKEFNLALEDKVEVINRASRVHVLLSSPSTSTRKCSTTPTSNRSIQEMQQEHQYGPTILSRQFNPMVVSGVVNRDTMPTSARRATCRLLKPKEQWSEDWTTIVSSMQWKSQLSGQQRST